MKMIHYEITQGELIAFSLIASLAVVENAAFAAVTLKNHWMLKVPYNALVFSLVITDLLTGLSILATPAYILGNHIPEPKERESGGTFCYLLFSHFLPFALGSVSLFTVTLLALERWCAVVSPLNFYKFFRDSSKMVIQIISVWFLGFLVTCILFTDVRYEFVNKTASWECSFKNLTKTPDGNVEPEEIALAILDFLRFLIPFTISVVCLTSLNRHLRRNRSIGDIQSSTYVERDNAHRMVSKMATVTAIVMLVCWLPNHVTFFMYKVGLRVSLMSGYHRATVILCMSNSCINPVIYLVTNKVYRDEFIEVFTCKNLGLRQSFNRLHGSFLGSTD